ncbi:hypothetical protein J5N97_001271 [Dioscorea zingiberensis]|uniref:Uncharacterized protein n=1 Tax=Dioscorea zingiberensis TaxID=325984 RepID=A0A9D5BU68_9LILI|nr:hypothetical protein J5N97_001271 [Dioscorea zingiberensis]
MAISSSFTDSGYRRPAYRKPMSFRRRFMAMVKQEKTRFYIFGRCVSMLLCWHGHDSSD